MEALYPAIATLVAYLIGSLSFAVVVSRAMGLNDPRTYGSKNPGATNVPVSYTHLTLPTSDLG